MTQPEIYDTLFRKTFLEALKMNIKLELVGKDKKEILRNLIEKYETDFSQYDEQDVNDLGLFGYDYLDNYWTEANRFPYFIKVNEKLAGFVMINDYPIAGYKTDYTIAEFFIMPKYRRSGVGKCALDFIFQKFKGKWCLMYHPKNVAAQRFWTKMVNHYTDGKYTLITDNSEVCYHDGTLGHVFNFEI